MTPRQLKDRSAARDAAFAAEKADAREKIRALISAYEAARDEVDQAEARRLRFHLQGAMVDCVDLDTNFVSGWPRRILLALIHHIGAWRDMTAPPFVRAEAGVLIEGQIQLVRKIFDTGATS